MKSVYKLLALMLAMSMCLSLLAGCAKKSAPETVEPITSGSVEEFSEEETVEEPAEESLAIGTVAEASIPEVVPESSAPAEGGEEVQEGGSAAPSADYPYDYTVKMDVTGVDFDALSALDNESVPYGFATADRDDLNRPNGIYYYDNLYKDAGGCVTHIDTEEKLVYLTMDEGYEAGHTPQILDTLKEKGVKAVFFITKQFFDEHPELIQRMIDEGHIIGNHTCAHKAGGMPQLGAQAQYEDYKWLNDAVYEKFGYQMKLFRYPEGVGSKQSVQLINQMGYKPVFWSFAYRDFDLDNQMDSADALSQCLDQVHPGAVYLLHAVSATNTEILGDYIDGVREKGYEFGVFPVESAPSLN